MFSEITGAFLGWIWIIICFKSWLNSYVFMVGLYIFAVEIAPLKLGETYGETSVEF